VNWNPRDDALDRPERESGDEDARAPRSLDQDRLPSTKGRGSGAQCSRDKIRSGKSFDRSIMTGDAKYANILGAGRAQPGVRLFSHSAKCRGSVVARTAQSESKAILLSYEDLDRGDVPHLAGLGALDLFRADRDVVDRESTVP
jgi:hypothetical protein